MSEGREPLLPELARSVRSLGGPADDATMAAQAAVFVPLLDARARAAQHDRAEAIAALHGAALAARIESLARGAATAGIEDRARARARVAAVRELLEPLHEALARLDQVAPAAGREDADPAAWAGWIASLRTVFSAADVACRELTTLLAQVVMPDQKPSRWRVRGPDR